MNGYKPHWPQFPDIGHFTLVDKLIASGFVIYVVIAFPICLIFVSVLLHKMAKFLIGPLVYVFYAIGFMVIMEILSEYVFHF